MADIFQLKHVDHDMWSTVTKEEWIRAERGAGFYPKYDSDSPQYWTTCATGGFETDTIIGRIRYMDDTNGASS